MREFSAVLCVSLACAAPALADGAFCPAPAGRYEIPAPPVGDVVLSDLNMRAESSCGQFTPTDQRGGFFDFTRTTRSMLEQGIACLERQGLRDPLNRFRAILKPGSTPSPILLVCGNDSDRKQVSVHGTSYGVTGIASALTPAMSGYPGVIFNMDWIHKSPAQSFKAAFFHELFHAAGYDHEHNVDYAYFGAGCCFEANADACDLLRRSTRHGEDWWKSQEYLVDAVKWFYGRDNVAWDLIHSAAQSAESPDNRAAVIAALIQFRANLAGEGTLTTDRRRTLIQACEAMRGGPVCRRAF